jgi:sugar phosphate isomerase/epimerase
MGEQSGLEVSIGSWGFVTNDKPLDFEATCAWLQGAGFKEIAVGGFGEHPNPGRPAGDEGSGPYAGEIKAVGARKEFTARIKEEYGLTFSGFAPNLWSQQLINTDDPSQYIAEFDRNSKFAYDLGIKGIRVDCVQKPDILRQVARETAINRVVTAWQTISDIAADRGQYIMWEPEPGFAFCNWDDIPEIYAKVDRENFGIQYDTCHGECIGVEGHKQVTKNGIYVPENDRLVFSDQVEFLQYLEQKGVNINDVHLIDSNGKLHDDDTSEHVPMGEGRVSFDTVTPELLRIAKLERPTLTLDVCFWPDAKHAASVSLPVARSLINQYGKLN